MLDLIDIKLFYPMLFTAIAMVLIVFICSTKAVLIRFKDNNSEDFRFKTHVQEHMDITDKMKDMHNKVVFTESHEKELDTLEKGFDKLTKDVEELKEKVDLLVSEMIKLKKTHS